MRVFFREAKLCLFFLQHPIDPERNAAENLRLLKDEKLLQNYILYSYLLLAGQDAVHITAILGESVIFNCHVEFPGDHPVPYVLQWEKKVSETV